MLVNAGSNSPVDGLRFSYEVSFTEDSEAQEFEAYLLCSEQDAVDDPSAACGKMMSAYSNHFVLWNETQKSLVCNATIVDIERQDDYCGYIAVSAYQAYQQYYTSLQRELADWHTAVMQKSLEELESTVTTVTLAQSLLDEVTLQPQSLATVGESEVDTASEL